MIERNAPAARWVGCLGACELVAITALTGIGEVGRSMTPTTRAGDNMLDSKGVWGVGGGRETVFAPSACALRDQPALASGRAAFRHVSARRFLTAPRDRESPLRAAWPVPPPPAAGARSSPP